jgi:hypothetical protein
MERIIRRVIRSWSSEIIDSEYIACRKQMERSERLQRCRVPRSHLVRHFDGHAQRGAEYGTYR